MDAAIADQQLVRAYATEASETAFQSLVQRHLDLVYATALRQLGDPALAEEVSQNVFLALAHKAPRLTGLETLAGWLHRTTILEAKARIRAELRRRRREEKAAELMALQHEGTSAFASLIPLIDEALLHLRENDRTALILRFLEGNSLRDVGAAMGLDEEAARKRVSRALERVTDFFRQHGFTIPAGTGAGAVLAAGTSAAPAGLAVTIAEAGVASGGAAAGLNLLYLHLMALTKPQIAMMCALLAAIPLVSQKRAEARLTAEHADVAHRIAAAGRELAELEAAIAQTRNAALRTDADTLAAERRLEQLRAQLQGRAPAPEYRWDDNSPVMRVPKELLNHLHLSAMANKRGQLNERIIEVLQFTEAETQSAQEAINRFLAAYHQAKAAKMKEVPPTERELDGRPPEEVRVFEMGSVREEVQAARQVLFAELEAVLGAEDRFQLFRKALDNWMPLEDEEHYGINSSMAVFSFEHRERFGRPAPGAEWIPWGIAADGGLISASMAIADIPDIYRPRLADWIALAQSQPANQ